MSNIQCAKPHDVETLHNLFRKNSKAARYYHKQVLAGAESKDDVYSMTYRRPISEERRDLFQLK